jgi:nucleotide-binding universal stress UspA family protein
MTSTQGITGGVFRHILVGYDGSAEAQKALRVATALAMDVHGELHVLSVIRSPAYAETSDEIERARESERQNLTRGLNNTDTHVHVVFDEDPAQAMIEYVEEHGFDLVVIGSHGRERITHRGLGHSLEALLRRLPCPVLVV